MKLILPQKLKSISPYLKNNYFFTNIQKYSHTIIQTSITTSLDKIDDVEMFQPPRNTGIRFKGQQISIVPDDQSLIEIENHNAVAQSKYQVDDQASSYIEKVDDMTMNKFPNKHMEMTEKEISPKNPKVAPPISTGE